MGAPEPVTNVSIGHSCFIVFSGDGTVKKAMKDYGALFDAKVADDTIHAMLVDPRFKLVDVTNYIEELGGTVYEYVETPGQNN